mmetsp:Transcript_3997/g.11978  ORF Transcript_3997/g.11978 Transcript_3997/m.11978 type:complete len:219 (+) Transcript_3997:213-869(+)
MWAQNHGIEGYEKRFHLTEGIFYGWTRGTNVKWAYSEAVPLLKHIPKDIQKIGSDMRIRAVAKVDTMWGGIQETSVADAAGNTTSTSTFAAQSHLVRARTDATWRMRSGAFEVRGSEYVYSDVITVRLPPRTLRNSFYFYVAEMVFMALLVCIIPPVFVGLLWRKAPAGGYVQKNFRRAIRAFSQRDIAEEVARLRDQRKGPKFDLRMKMFGARESRG